MTILDFPADPDRPIEAQAATRHDVHMEQAILGAIMQSAAVRDEVTATALTGTDFYRPVHEEIWQAITGLAEARRPVDPKTVAAELERLGALARVGGYAYLHTLIEAVTSPWTAPTYARRVLGLSAIRRLDASGMKVRQLAAASTDDDVDESIAAAIAEVAAVAETRNTCTSDGDISEIIDETLDDIENGSAPAVPTGLVYLDGILSGGLRPGTVTTIGARPGVGKTIVGLQIALNVAVLTGQPVGYTSLEMTPSDLMKRGIAAVSSVDYGRILKSPGEPLTRAEWDATSRAAELIRASGLLIPTRRTASVASIRADIRRAQRERGSCALWVVDYLQLVTPADSRVIREQQVSSIMRGLKMTALELGTPLLLLAQLSREGEKTGRVPITTDLRESGSIEQDSDNIVLLHRVQDPEQATDGPRGRGDADTQLTGPDQISFAVAKNRRGARSGFATSFVGPHQRVGPRDWCPRA